MQTVLVRIRSLLGLTSYDVRFRRVMIRHREAEDEVLAEVLRAALTGSEQPGVRAGVSDNPLRASLVASGVNFRDVEIAPDELNRRIATRLTAWLVDEAKREKQTATKRLSLLFCGLLVALIAVLAFATR